jgi:type III secretion system YscI/HrpB-like protein
MDIVRPDVLGTAETLKQAKGGAPEAAPGGKPFDQVMDEVDGSGMRMHSPEVTVLQPDQGVRVRQLEEEKTRIAKEPDGIQRLGSEIERGTVRMNELLNDLRSGRTFSPQELLGVQAEMSDITLQIEVTTKVISETASGVRQLMQQQA